VGTVNPVHEKKTYWPQGYRARHQKIPVAALRVGRGSLTDRAALGSE
jgi:hypothetical protein